MLLDLILYIQKYKRKHIPIIKIMLKINKVIKKILNGCLLFDFSFIFLSIIIFCSVCILSIDFIYLIKIKIVYLF